MATLTKEQAIALAKARQRALAKSSAAEDTRKFEEQIRGDLTGDMSGVEKFNAGMGKAFTDLGSGAAQLFGMGPTGEEVKEKRRLDAPLMSTGEGLAGNISGNIAAIAPAAVIPGVNSVAGAGAMGAIVAGLQPTEGVGERLTNMAVGGGMGAGTQAVAGPLAQRLGERAAIKEREALAAELRNSVRDQTLREGHQAGFVVPPSAVNRPTFIGGRMESLAGKAALNQEASLRNQSVTDDLARKAAGLQPDEPISTATLKAARQRMSVPYQEAAGLSPQAASDLDLVKSAKIESKLQWGHFNRSGDPNAFKAANAADATADAALNRIEQTAQSAGKAGLVRELRKARVDIARNHEVRNALNAGDGSVDASTIGRAFDRNPDRFSGELKTIGAFQQAFPKFMQEGSKVQAPGVGKTELLASALLAGGGGMATGDPTGLLAGLAPFASHPARALMLSRALQSAIANPSYRTGVINRGTAALKDPETRRRVGLMARALALPAIPQFTSE